MKNIWFYEFPVGTVGIAEQGGAITNVFFGSGLPSSCEKKETALIQKAAGQLREYFNKERREFDLPLLLEGTTFQLSVWGALCRIPFGQTRSYKEIAVMVGNEKACRAVGLANNRNPVSIIVPCHRVIGQDGSLTGYGGGLPAKQLLLDLENN